MNASWDFICPECRSPLGAAEPDVRTCGGCGLAYRREQGIWRFLTPARAAAVARHVGEYETVRRDERRAILSREQLEALPFTDTTGERQAEWDIRARSYQALLAHLPGGNLPAPRVLDLGCGNGWLSRRLAERGHVVAGIDLLSNEADGLGAHHHFAGLFTSIQADFDRLPIAGGAADVVVFNGALHYAASYDRTLAEALRVLAPGGRIMVMDSPIYDDPASGRRMVEEREAAFERRYGFRGDTLGAEGFLTTARLAELSARLGLRWTVVKPAHGLRWALRPVVARLLGRRQPAAFDLLVATRAADPA